ncbi:hypothetical protein CHLRE_13g569150v5 [Chlamydomonas reinhardtii]|uniref:Uncharacterized protein n=1 Tax=Chlamydomonas reinhardtii TaxID=3055 RepID=A0A2K3CZJ5_CHLRE|nr:uncharacterized protein CHLRE_13g569150v5 [Chlamydomonas reinhardtii]XP_042917317.1 uncharacterized protein CHLRE_13g569150v5 [Chlamydomonas reinhardtii]PNW73702.1 hypothetical protein CHLRE_13g569150v5 [Chlamydomonas reinhardtii]PNW73703.1 hypothetical protein CHLRE_13g569150v5 [Chlamydomonas reinhardtii]
MKKCLESNNFRELAVAAKAFGNRMKDAEARVLDIGAALIGRPFLRQSIHQAERQVKEGERKMLVTTSGVVAAGIMCGVLGVAVAVDIICPTGGLVTAGTAAAMGIAFSAMVPLAFMASGAGMGLLLASIGAATSLHTKERTVLESIAAADKNQTDLAQKCMAASNIAVILQTCFKKLASFAGRVERAAAQGADAVRKVLPTAVPEIKLDSGIRLELQQLLSNGLETYKVDNDWLTRQAGPKQEAEALYSEAVRMPGANVVGHVSVLNRSGEAIQVRLARANCTLGYPRHLEPNELYAVLPPTGHLHLAVVYDIELYVRGERVLKEPTVGWDNHYVAYRRDADQKLALVCRKALQQFLP